LSQLFSAGPSPANRKKNQKIVFECERLDFKMYSLRDALWFKQGYLQFVLPEGIDYPEGYKTTQEKGLRRILNKLKNNK
jgi:hypothetical protein